MIKNNKQYRLTLRKLEEFESLLKELKESSPEIHPIQARFQIETVESQIIDFKEELQEYDVLRKGNISTLRIESWDELLVSLIKARIIKGWTQSVLATKVGLKEQQIQRYEACNYSTASIQKIKEIADALGLEFKSFQMEIDVHYIFSPTIDNEEVSRLQERISKAASLFDFV